MEKLIKALIALVVTLCLPAGSLAAPADWPKELNFGLIPTESSDNITERFDNLAKYPGEKARHCQ